jgi:carbon-monoxide dehydrogenase medium subunit
MKAPPFEYVKARSIDEALALLAQHGDDARILAGGQTLLATLNMRLSEPALLVDITGIAGLRGIAVAATGCTSAPSPPMPTSRRRRWSPSTRPCWPPPRRTSRTAPSATAAPGAARIAYADPAAEWPCCLVALEGNVTVQGPGGRAPSPPPTSSSTCTPPRWRRTRSWSAPMSRWPPPPTGSLRRTGAAPRRLRGGRAGRRGPLRRHPGARGAPRVPGRRQHAAAGAQTEALLAGKQLDLATIEIAVASLKSELDPPADLHHAGETKRHLATVLARRLLTAAQASRAAITA